MQVPKAYLDYLVYFHIKRDYFECHEVLEEYWQDNGRSGTIWVGLIQIASAFYHYRRKNVHGARKLLNRSIKALKNQKSRIEEMGLDSEKLHFMLEETIKRIDQCLPYRKITLPIKDKEILDFLLSEEKKYSKEALIPNEFVINKHKRRDRSAIITAREHALKYRQQKRDQ